MKTKDRRDRFYLFVVIHEKLNNKEKKEEGVVRVRVRMTRVRQ